MKHKTTCAVIGCTRYRNIEATDQQKTVHLCREHWMGLPKAQRLEMNKAFRVSDAEPTRFNILNTIRLWEACVDRAIQNELGIASPPDVGL